MNWIKGAMATCGFELRRSLTTQRIVASIVMILFPPAMIMLVQAPAVGLGSEFATFQVISLVGLVTVLSLLLWGTPNVHSELEGKSWVFVASRPGGRVSIFIGKYLATVYSSFLVSWAAITLSVFVISQVGAVRDPLRLWATISLIFLIGCAVYAAVFSMIGTLFTKRSMVIGVGYFLVSELLVGSIPAVIGKLTARYHLQSLGISWIPDFLPDDRTAYDSLFGAPAPVFNFSCLVGICLLCLIVGVVVIVNRQYVTKDES